ncbi:MAG: response regulator [Acidobacteriia bacterium]|nr:response regulator [Terriglobia bacterium]
MAEILIIDDNPAVRDVLGEVLRGAGYEVSTAANGAEALTHMRTKGAPSLILLDLMMPVMNGWEFRSEQLKDPSLRAVPTIILTTVANIMAEAKLLKANGFISKSTAYGSILELVRTYC